MHHDMQNIGAFVSSPIAFNFDPFWLWKTWDMPKKHVADSGLGKQGPRKRSGSVWGFRVYRVLHHCQAYAVKDVCIEFHSRPGGGCFSWTSKP